MLRRSIKVLLGLIDRAAGAWVRWRAGRRVSDPSGIEIPMRVSQPPADWVRRVRRGAPGLLEPSGNDHSRVNPTRLDSPPGEQEILRQSHQTAPARSADSAASSAAVEPAAPRASDLDVPAPTRPRAERTSADDSDWSRPPRGEREAETPAAETPAVGDDHPSRGPVTPQRLNPASKRPVAVDHLPSELPARAPGSVEQPPGNPVVPAMSAKSADPRGPAPGIPMRLSAPTSTEPTPRNIHQPDLAAEPRGRPAEARPHPLLADDTSASASHRWPNLPDPPEEGGPDTEAALRKWERGLQVAREQSRL